MTVLYDGKDLTAVTRKRKTLVISSVAVFAAVLAFCISSCFFVTQTSATIIKIVDSVLFTAAAWFLFFVLTREVPELNRRITHLKNVLKLTRERKEITVESFGGKLTLSNGVTALEVWTTDGIRLFWEMSLGACPFAEGDSVTVTVADNYITEYKVAE